MCLSFVGSLECVWLSFMVIFGCYRVFYIYQGILSVLDVFSVIWVCLSEFFFWYFEVMWDVLSVLDD